jgi:hypothetical protein
MFSGAVPSMFARLLTTLRQFAIQLLRLLMGVGLLAVVGGLFPLWVVLHVPRFAGFGVAFGCLAVAMLVRLVIDRIVPPAMRGKLLLLWTPFMFAAVLITYGEAAPMLAFALGILLFVMQVIEGERTKRRATTRSWRDAQLAAGNLTGASVALSSGDVSLLQAGDLKPSDAPNAADAARSDGEERER